MARQRRHSRTNSRRYERKIQHRQWFTNAGFGGTATVTLKAGNDTDNLIKIFVDPLKGDDQTVLRTRGFVNFSDLQAGEPMNGVFGMTVLPNKTAENGTASDLPNPLVDADTTDWFVWQPISVPNVDTSSSSTEQDIVVAELSPPMLLEIDSKAKRIIEAAESVVGILGLGPKAAISSKEIEFQYLIRTLVGY